mmetsp:Transcript_38886/g.111248  ORF Transcript_38886/g.111248 Transcript_38886/m.111248 type:complete len:210 (+) Transcript_38886:665-1294(+)
MGAQFEWAPQCFIMTFSCAAQYIDRNPDRPAAAIGVNATLASAAESAGSATACSGGGATDSDNPESWPVMLSYFHSPQAVASMYRWCSCPSDAQTTPLYSSVLLIAYSGVPGAILTVGANCSSMGAQFEWAPQCFIMTFSCAAQYIDRNPDRPAAAIGVNATLASAAESAGSATACSGGGATDSDNPESWPVMLSYFHSPHDKWSSYRW